MPPYSTTLLPSRCQNDDVRGSKGEMTSFRYIFKVQFGRSKQCLIKDNVFYLLMLKINLKKNNKILF